MKKFLALTIGLVLLAGVCGTAMAGSENRYRWEGAIIGAGALLLLNEILKQPQCEYRASGYAPRRCGHWESRRHWIPPKYREAWCEGYYDRRHRWIPGRWTRVKVRDGHYRTTRVWIMCR